MELGRYLVSENLGQRSNDTLSRWLLHAIAERISLADSATKPTEKKKLQSDAAELILRLWSHRAVVPNGVNPLARYDKVLKAFRSLLPGANPWESRDAKRNDRIAAKLYQSFTMLTFSLLLIGLDDVEERSATERILHNQFLPSNESAVLLMFEQIEELTAALPERDKSPERPERTRLKASELSKLVQNWAAKTIELAQEASALVNELEPLDKEAPSKRGSPDRRTKRQTNASTTGKRSSTGRTKKPASPRKGSSKA